MITGKQAIDDDSNQTGQMLAALAWAGRKAPFAHKLDLEEGKAVIEREIDGGLQTVEVEYAGGDERSTCASTSRAMLRCRTS